MRRPKLFANLRVGEPDTTPALPSHVPGVAKGNRGSAASERGFRSTGPSQRRGVSDIRATAERSTGISPRAREPIDPRMPNLPPS